MHKVKLKISYDGTDFEGWQRQTDGKPTIQASIEMGLSKIFNTPIVIQGSGRTDSGVHAEAQYAHFWAPKNPKNIQLVKALNSQLPRSVSILGAWIAPEEYHAQKSAIEKTYRYEIHNSPIPDPLKTRYRYWIKKDLNINHLNELTGYLVGTHDFKSFQTSGTQLKSTVRTISSAKWERVSPHLVVFTVTGNGFLKQMVRNIVGTLIYLSQNHLTEKDLLQILEACDRSAAKMTAPAHGLYLQSVKYPSELDFKCLEI